MSNIIPQVPTNVISSTTILSGNVTPSKVYEPRWINNQTRLNQTNVELMRANLIKYIDMVSSSLYKALIDNYNSLIQRNAGWVDISADGANSFGEIFNDYENNTVAKDKKYQAAFGHCTTANGESQFVCGQFNEEEENALFIVGCGSDDNNKQNAIVVTEDGIVEFLKDVTHTGSDKFTGMVTFEDFVTFDKAVTVKGKPTNKTHVVRKKELDDLRSEISGALHYKGIADISYEDLRKYPSINPIPIYSFNDDLNSYELINMTAVAGDIILIGGLDDNDTPTSTGQEFIFDGNAWADYSTNANYVFREEYEDAIHGDVMPRLTTLEEQSDKTYYELSDVDELDNLSASAKEGDFAIVKEKIADNNDESNIKYSYTAYVADMKNKTLIWRALDGNYNANNVFISTDIITTTRIGELASNERLAAGTSMTDIISQILSKEYQPEITLPSITKLAVTLNDGSTDYEVGTKINKLDWEVNFNSGSYYFTHADGSTIPVKSTESYDEINPIDGTGVEIGNCTISYDDITIGDELIGASNITEEKYLTDATTKVTASVTYSAGNHALTNLNKRPTSDTRIAEGSTTKVYTITPYRKIFAGGTEATEINSDTVRSLDPEDGKSPIGKVPVGKNVQDVMTVNTPIYFNVKAGSTRLLIALPGDIEYTPTVEMYTMSWGSFVGELASTKITVAGADNDVESSYAKDYTVYECLFSTPLEADLTQFRAYFN